MLNDGRVRPRPYIYFDMTIFQFRYNFAKLNPLAIGEEILLEDGDEVADVVRNQLEEGLDGDGNKITRLDGRGGYQSTVYAIEKYRRNSKPGMFIPDLKDTGDFHRKMYYDPNTDSIDSKDWKRDDLVDKYGLPILEVGVGIEAYRPKFNEKFKEKVNAVLAG